MKHKFLKHKKRLDEFRCGTTEFQKTHADEINAIFMAIWNHPDIDKKTYCELFSGIILTPAMIWEIGT